MQFFSEMMLTIQSIAVNLESQIYEYLVTLSLFVVVLHVINFMEFHKHSSS